MIVSAGKPDKDQRVELQLPFLQLCHKKVSDVILWKLRTFAFIKCSETIKKDEVLQDVLFFFLFEMLQCSGSSVFRTSCSDTLT